MIKHLLHFAFSTVITFSIGGWHTLFAQDSFAGCGTESWHITDVSNGKPNGRIQALATDARYRWRPAVIRNDRKEPVLYEFKAPSNTTFTSLIIALSSGETYTLRDDGTSGDRMAGDLIYTAQIPVSLLTSKVSSSRPYRPFVGYLRMMNGSTVLAQYNLIAEVWNPTIPSVKIKALSATVQASRHLVNIVVPVQDLNAIPNNDFRSITQTFYRYYGDSFDFFNIIHLPCYFGNRYHGNINNTIQGIGFQTLTNSSSQYGSSGKLIGFNMYPITSFFDGAGKAYAHELGHQWINFLSNSAFDAGIPHWPLSNIGSGIMGISIGGKGGAGGEFSFSIVLDGTGYKFQPFTSVYKTFNNWELYLMGLVPPDSVSATLVLADQTQTASIGAAVKGSVTSVNLSSVIQQFGSRLPGVSASPKSYSIATIIVSDVLLTQEEMAYYDFFSARAGLKQTVYVEDGLSTYTGAPFGLSTGGRAEMNPVVDPTLTVSGQTSVHDTPASVFKAQLFPQPSSGETTLEYLLIEPSSVKVEVISVLGETIHSLPLGSQQSGVQRLLLNTTQYSAGLYFVRLVVGDRVVILPMQVTK